MKSQTDIPSLSQIESTPYLDESGYLPQSLDGKIGVYAIIDPNQVLQYIGYSRNVYLSLKQHLIRKPQSCDLVKVKTIERPSRTLLEEIKAAWIAENGSIPVGNAAEESQWNQAIDVKPLMNASEQEEYKKLEGLGQEKCLKNVARRVEAEILEILKQRGVQEEIRFNPKLKSSGLLDLK
ncbi:MAG: GIY-YIG nuclease family protein [Microcoleaceae cyanobacterium]